MKYRLFCFEPVLHLQNVKFLIFCLSDFRNPEMFCRLVSIFSYHIENIHICFCLRYGFCG
ncbi:hypothetical protein HanIR_Chr11g0557611 [Helianthus annuus]|nr:hypothetical protein HanIR_Chr11g0557611 [Helianthus annuus]